MDTPTLVTAAGSQVSLWSFDCDENEYYSKQFQLQLQPFDSYRPVAFPNHHITALAWNKDILLAVGNDGTLDVRTTNNTNKNTTELLWKTRRNGEAIRCCAAANSRFMTIGTNDGSVEVWDMNKKMSVKRYDIVDEREHSSNNYTNINTNTNTYTNTSTKTNTNTTPITCVEFDATATVHASATRDGRIVVHDVATSNQRCAWLTTNRLRNRYQPQTHLAITGIAFNRSGKISLHLASAAEDGTVEVRDIGAEQTVNTAHTHEEGTMVAVRSQPRNATEYVSVATDKRLNVYDVNRKGMCIATYTLEYAATAMDIDTDGLKVAVGCANGIVQMYDMRRANKPMITMVASKEGHAIASVKFPCRKEKIHAARNLTGVKTEIGHSALPVAQTGGTGATHVSQYNGATTMASTSAFANILPKREGDSEKTSLDSYKISPLQSTQSSEHSVTTTKSLVSPPTSYFSANALERRTTQQQQDLRALSSTVANKPSSMPVASIAVASRYAPHSTSQFSNGVLSERPSSSATMQSGISDAGTAFSTATLRALLQEEVEEVQSCLRQDINNMHLELIKNAYSQQSEMATLFGTLISEIKQLRAEVQKLKEVNDPFGV